jgi:hypothetical protein
MKKIIRVTESELVKMIGKVINEQQSTPEQAIAREFAGAAGGPGTNLPGMGNAIKKIKNVAQYEEVNKILKGINGLDIAGYINDECEFDNVESVKTFINQLGKIGVTASAEYYKDKYGKGPYFKQNSFKITSANAPGTAMNPLGGLNPFTQQKGLNINCIGLKSPETNKTITGINGDTVKFMSDGTFVDAKGQRGKYVCGNQANIVNLMYDSDPKAVKYFNMSPKPATQQQQQKTKTVFTANETFPLKFQQKGEAIKKIQTALGVKPTGQFWTVTEKAVLAKAPEYKRATGVTEDIYNKIVGGQTTVNPNINQQLLQRGKEFQNKNAETIRQNSQLSQQKIADRNKLNIRQ